MTSGRLIEWPVCMGPAFDHDRLDKAVLHDLLECYPVLAHFVWGHRDRGVIEDGFLKLALCLAMSGSDGYDTDTNLSLRRLLEARDLYRHTRERLLVDNPGGNPKDEDC